MFKFILKTTLILCVSLLLSIGLDYFYRGYYKEDYRFPKGLLTWPTPKEQYDIVYLGNSHSESGIDLSHYKLKWLSLASVAQTYEYDFAMLKMNKNRIKKNAIIIINVSPISFSQHKPTTADDVNINYYDGRLSPFLIPHFRLAEYIQVQLMPFVRSGYMWRSKYDKLQNDMAMDVFAKQWKQPKEETTLKITPTSTLEKVIIRDSIASYNVFDINKELELPSATSDAKFDQSVNFMVNKWHDKSGFNKEWFATSRKDLQNIINYCLDNNWRPVLTSIPISKALQDKLGKDYYQKFVYDNLAQINTRNLPYFNFVNDKRLTEDKFLFSNSDHLNSKGGAIFSYLLLQKLIENKYLTKNADGYDYSQKEVISVQEQ